MKAAGPRAGTNTVPQAGEPGISHFLATELTVASSHTSSLTKGPVTKPLQGFLASISAQGGLYLPVPAGQLSLLALGSADTAVCVCAPQGVNMGHIPGTLP